MNINEKVIQLKTRFPEKKTFSKLETENGPPGWFTDDDKKVYRELFEAIPNNGVALEIGCLFGRSLASVADIIIRKNIRVFALDTFDAHKWNNDWDKLGISSHYDTFLDVMKEYKIYKYVCAIAHTSLAASGFLNAEQFDLIFLDSDHSYNYLTKEIEKYKPKLKKNGIMSGHDYSPEFPQVIRAVKEAFGEVYNEANIWATPATWRTK